ncbi:uncharacterized protein DUF4157 [Dyadobacter jejuensis]|uniref:Uncharacterized protein DUF4157 n=1 Tax=Dyadobacter jejuensis TaxID=1082580 RepID=A0A316AIK5_9BACT|nr:DUF4157 domain-containing protein [Dyadobacter jejuensis]PWJ57482.1 uncharacterized protein DUF4157 [Dyadobacter jejuensis]
MFEQASTSTKLHSSKPVAERLIPHAGRQEVGSHGALRIQPKLSIGSPNDPYEKEADAVANRVMRMPLLTNPSHRAEPSLQRKCASCAHEKEEIQRKPTEITPFIQRSSQSGGLQASDRISSEIAATKGSGTALPAPTRSFMESRFNHDFSSVRIHTGSPAIQLSENLQARAFTVGQDIYFNSQQYNPTSDTGQHLLAHELTHTLQQGAGVDWKIQKQGETGTSEYEEHVSSTVTNTAEPGITSGTVTRREFVSTDTPGGRRQIHRSDVDLVFDANTCRITIPYKVKFVHQSDTDSTHCRDLGGRTPDPIRPVSASTFRTVANQFLRANNEGLNGWFLLRLTNAPGHPCNGRNIPIVVEATEVTTDPDTTVIITANRGRSYVSGDGSVCTLCNNPSYDVMVHEAGHMTLGFGDEYSERSRRSAETERLTDSSRMAQVGPERLQVFRERHFAFVPAFIQNIIPGCRATLIFGEQPRYTPIVYPSLSLSGVTGGMSGFLISGGLDMGIPLDALRRTEILLGPRVGLLLGSNDEGDMLAFLYGMRLGLSGSFDTRLFNQQLLTRVGTYMEYGGGRDLASIHPIVSPNFTYLEMGATLGVRLPSSGLEISAQAGFGALDLDSPRTIDILRWGLTIGGSL